MTTINTHRFGTMAGRTVESIVRREYGRNAEIRIASSSSPEFAMVTKTDEHGTHVLDTITSYEGVSERVAETNRMYAEAGL